MKHRIAFLSVALALSAHADDQSDAIERIVVTSDFRSISLQALPSSVSIIGEQQVEQRQAQHLQDILNLAANVNFSTGASRGRFVQIRGIGERSQFAEPINPSVAFIVDDLDFSGILGMATLFDVEQVEVLRGPVATEFGAGAMAGAIKLKTAEPTQTASGKVEAGWADYDTYNIGAAYGNSLSQDWSFRVALHQQHSDGFLENAFLQRDDTNSIDEFTGRVKLRYAPSDDYQLDISLQTFDIDNGYDAFSLDNDRITQSDEPGFDRQQTDFVSLRSVTNLEYLTFEVIAGASQSELGYGYDEDWTFEGFHPFGYTSTDHYFRERDSRSIDVRLLSNANSALFSDATDWTLGLFYRDVEEDLVREYTFLPADYTYQYAPTTLAVYLHTDTRLSQDLTLRAGLRVEQFDQSLEDSDGINETFDDTLVGGKLSLDYTRNNTTWYGSLSRGYKAGGFNQDNRLVNADRFFQPEYNWNYEVGVKSWLPEQDITVRAAVFYMDRDDNQVSSFAVLQRDDGSASFIDFTSNTDLGVNQGIETEITWQVNQALLLGLNAGYLDATNSAYERGDGSVVEARQQAQAPRYTFAAYADLMLTDALEWSLNVEGKDEFFFSDGHNEKSPSYVLVHTSLAATWEDWKVRLWARNLFDRDYFTRGFGGFSNDPRDEYAFEEPYYQLGDPRQVGISVQYSF